MRKPWKIKLDYLHALSLRSLSSMVLDLGLNELPLLVRSFVKLGSLRSEDTLLTLGDRLHLFSGGVPLGDVEG